MKKSYRTLEFSFIQDYIKNYCFSEMAKKRIDQIQPFQDIDDLNKVIYLKYFHYFIYLKIYIMKF